MKITKVARLVKSEDLNHHGTLFAGRAAEWFIEACFISGVQAGLHAEGIVCYNVHGFKFMEPANRGDIVRLESRIVRVGTTSYTVHGRICVNEKEIPSCEGFVTFVYVDDAGKKIPHSLVLDEATCEDEVQKRQLALQL